MVESVKTFTSALGKQALSSDNFKDAQNLESLSITAPSHALKRDLQARHVTMIAIGGALGTGLLIGSGAGLASAGPAALFLSYIIVGLIVYMVTCAIGEMATYLPLPQGFPGYASRFVDPTLGFTIGWTYWIKYVILSPSQLTAAALVLQFWVPKDKVNPGIWILIFMFVIIAINYFGVKFFGEFEFWLSSLKVVTIVAPIFCSLVIALGGAPDHDRRGFRFWKNPGAFKNFAKGKIEIEGNRGRFISFLGVLVTAVFAFTGSELVGVTVGETANPRRNIPRAIRLTFYRIFFFYLLSTLFLGMCVPYNDKRLVFANKSTTSAAASPYVVAMINSGIHGLPAVVNAAILMFVFSAANSDLYIATRTLYGMSASGHAPEIFSRTDSRGVPVYSLALSSVFGVLGFLNCSSASGKIFTYFVNVVSLLGLLAWVTILITHICFMNACKAQNIDRHRDLVYRSPFQPYGSYISLGFCLFIVLIKNFTVFIGKFDPVGFVTGYIGLPIFVTLFVGYKFWPWHAEGRPHHWKSGNVDLITYKDVIDEQEAEYLREKALSQELHPPSKATKLYDNTIGLLF